MKGQMTILSNPSYRDVAETSNTTLLQDLTMDGAELSDEDLLSVNGGAASQPKGTCNGNSCTNDG